MLLRAASVFRKLFTVCSLPLARLLVLLELLIKTDLEYLDYLNNLNYLNYLFELFELFELFV